MAVAVAPSYFLPHKKTSISDQLNIPVAFEERHQSLVKLQEKIDRIEKIINKTNSFYLSNFKLINHAVENLKEYLLSLEKEKHSLTMLGYWTDWINLQLPSSEITELEAVLSKKILSVTEKQYLDLVKKAMEFQAIENKLGFLNDFFEFTENDQPSSLSIYFSLRKDDLILKKQQLQETIESRKLEVKEGLNKREGFRLV